MAFSPSTHALIQALNLVLVLTGLLVTYLTLPTTAANLVSSTVVLDTPQKLDDTLGKPLAAETQLCLYNLTNGFELLQPAGTTAPKPTFERICVAALANSQFFDFNLSADASEYSALRWSNITLVDDADWALEVVTLNADMVGVIGAFGGEATLAAIQPLLYGALAMDAAALKPDGTGALNGGLFVRLTFEQYFRGYTTPILGTENLVAAALNLYSFSSVSALRDAIASGAEPAQKHTTTVRTGAGNNIQHIGELASYKGYTSLTNVDASHKPDQITGAMNWGLFEAPWDNAGNVNPATKGAFNVDGMRMLGSPQPPLPASSYPAAFFTLSGVDGVTGASGDSSLDLFDPQWSRSVRYDPTASDKLHGALHTNKYTFSDANGRITSAGVASAACAPLCDYGMTDTHVWQGADGLTYTLPAYGLANVTRSKITLLDASGSEEYFDATTETPSVWIEPFTGATVQARTGVLTAITIQKAWLDGSLFSTVLTSDATGDTAFVWPLFETKATFGLTADEAQQLAGAISLPYLILRLAALLGGLSALSSVVLIIVCLGRARSRSQTKVGPRAEPVDKLQAAEKGQSD